MRGLPILLLTLVLAACSEQGGPGVPGETDERFVGEWMIDQPLHATYEASWYDFHADGSLEHLGDCSFGGTTGPTGFVNKAGGQLRCEFAERWSAPDASTLVIDGACSDGRDRQIVLGFPTDTGQNASGLSAIDVTQVGGEDGWGHFQFDWSWQKCGDESCAPALTGVSCPGA